MKRISYSSLAFAAIVALGMVASSLAIAQELNVVCPGYTPNPNSVVVTPRVWGDCPASTLTIVNNYPALLSISDTDVECFGWTNLHLWDLSTNGQEGAVFENCSHYKLSAVFNGNGSQVGPGAAEGGLRISPFWWTDTDGRFMVRIGGNGEIACFGGRLPFYSFTSNWGVTYTPGTDIYMAVEYSPNALTQAAPATIMYKIWYNNTVYYSPYIPFDQANPLEGHGEWGELTPTHVGGFLQAPNQADPRGLLWNYSAQWKNIQFEGPSATPATHSTWGQLKSMYR
jgi:hypothetical protein